MGVSIRHGRGVGERKSAFDTVLRIESLRFGVSLASRSPPLSETGSGDADLVIDLTGTAAPQHVPVLTIDICGRTSLPEGVAGMLASRQGAVLVTRLDGMAVGRALPMPGDPIWLSRACDSLLSGAISLILQGVARYFAGRLTPLDHRVAKETSHGFLGTYLRSVTGGAVARCLEKIRRGKRPFYWQVAYRQIDGPGVAETGSVDGAPFKTLSDDGSRFYADPFVFEHQDRHYLFVEEFPYATGRGIISVAELLEDGSFSVPKAVIEEPHHLSYPQVFEISGEIFMIPESAAARELVLYRAEDFPGRWVRDTVLLSNVDFNDATLLQSGGRFWLFGTERFGYGSASDTMSVYSARSLRGHYESHPLNPIVIDRSAARPGGAFIRRGERLFLPVQDGARAYGGGLGLMELLRLDMDEVVFAPVQPIGMGPAWPRRGIHTVNRSGRVEVIDSAG
ncbi:glucosamine inositolphosphorylceramide transferase family protein [Rhizobium binxianense]